MSKKIDFDVFTLAEVAELLQLSRRRVKELGIPQIRLGARTIRYLREDVLHYLKKRTF